MSEILGKITGTTIAKIVSLLLPILLVLFPNNTSLISIDQQINNNSTIAAPKIIAAFEERDSDALEDLMCNNIKQNTENIIKEISKMFSCVEGNVVESSYDTGSHSFSADHGNGKQILQTSIDITIKTTQKEYDIGVVWETINTFQTEETGIRSILLQEKSPANNSLKRVYVIQATEGIGEWHE